MESAFNVNITLKNAILLTKGGEMKKALIAVDDTKGSMAVLATLHNLVQLPEEIVLLHVERLLGRSLMGDMLGDAELSTLREELKDTEFKEELDVNAEKILNYYKRELQSSGLNNIKTVIRDGIAAEEILKVAKEEDAGIIILGYSEAEGLSRIITGSVSKDVRKNAKIPVLVAKRPLACEEAYSWRDAYYAISLSTAVIIVMFFLGIFLEKVFLP